jgi:tyrosine-protein phosphatase SIW14
VDNNNLKRFQVILFTGLTLLGFKVCKLQGGQATGVRNFHQVDDHLFRGAQPSEAGFESLVKLGIKTIVDLEPGLAHSKWERNRAEALGMRYVNVPMSGLTAPSNDQIQRALAALESDSAEPVFVHCRRGKDRTGTVVACYRIAHDHWQNRRALSEARAMGMSRVERGMRRYILEFQPPFSSYQSECGDQRPHERHCVDVH